MDDYLLENEHVLKEFGGKKKVVLTNLRIIKFWKHANEKDFQDMHYRFIEAVKHSQKLNWSLVSVSFVLIAVGFLVLFFLSNLLVSGFLWLLGVIMLIQAYLFESDYIEIRAQNSSMVVHSNTEIAKYLRKYQNRYFRELNPNQ